MKKIFIITTIWAISLLLFAGGEVFAQNQQIKKFKESKNGKKEFQILAKKGEKYLNGKYVYSLTTKIKASKNIKHYYWTQYKKGDVENSKILINSLNNNVKITSSATNGVVGYKDAKGKYFSCLKFNNKEEEDTCSDNLEKGFTSLKNLQIYQYDTNFEILKQLPINSVSILSDKQFIGQKSKCFNFNLDKNSQKKIFGLSDFLNSQPIKISKYEICLNEKTGILTYFRIIVTGKPLQLCSSVGCDPVHKGTITFDIKDELTSFSSNIKDSDVGIEVLKKTTLQRLSLTLVSRSIRGSKIFLNILLKPYTSRLTCYVDSNTIEINLSDKKLQEFLKFIKNNEFYNLPQKYKIPDYNENVDLVASLHIKESNILQNTVECDWRRNCTSNLKKIFEEIGNICNVKKAFWENLLK
ncbi:MAG: hypothetical protein AAB732_02530 [Patescibacteria group bacterium]